MKIIIFGCGKIGATIISALSGEGHDIVAVDRNPQVVEETTTTYDVMGTVLTPTLLSRQVQKKQSSLLL